jgi:hypothetical protein
MSLSAEELQAIRDKYPELREGRSVIWTSWIRPAIARCTSQLAQAT